MKFEQQWSHKKELSHSHCTLLTTIKGISFKKSSSCEVAVNEVAVKRKRSCVKVSLLKNKLLNVALLEN